MLHSDAEGPVAAHRMTRWSEKASGLIEILSLAAPASMAFSIPDTFAKPLFGVQTVAVQCVQHRIPASAFVAIEPKQAHGLVCSTFSCAAVRLAMIFMYCSS